MNKFTTFLCMHANLSLVLTDDDDLVVSGWGDVDDMREDLLKDWGELLEKWDGRDKTRPSKLINMCRKVSKFSALNDRI